MSDSHDARNGADPAEDAARPEAVGNRGVPPARGGDAGPSLFVHIAGAVVIALLAVVAAQSFFTARDVSVTSQNVVALAARLQAETERSQKLYDEVVILRGQVGEFKNILQVTQHQSAEGGAGDRPPGPRDWTGVYISELAPLLPVLAQYEGDMGEAWIYTDNEKFLDNIARALEALQEGGVEVNVEQPPE
jgi:hypothetical protein